MAEETKKKSRNAKWTPRHSRKILSRAWAFTQIMHGRSREEVLQVLRDRYGYTERTAEIVYGDVMHRVTNRMMMEANTIYDRNLQRLENIIDDSIEEEDMGGALKAIQEQNKMIGVGEKRNITIQNGEDTPEFKIKIED